MDLNSAETLSDASSASDLSNLMSEQPKSANSDVIDEINETKNRNRMMRSHFREMIPSDQVCIAGIYRIKVDFSCALMKNGLLRQGRLYVTIEYLAFHSFIAKTKEVMSISSIKSIIPKTVMLLPTSMIIETFDDGEMWELGSFLFRDNCIKTIETLRKATLRKSTSSVNTASLVSPNEQPSRLPWSNENSASSTTLASDQEIRKRISKKVSVKQIPSIMPTSKTSLVLNVCLGAICLINVMLLVKAFQLLLRF